MMNLRIHCKQLQMANDSSPKINEKRLLSKLSKFISILKYSVIIKKQIIFIFLFNWYWFNSHSVEILKKSSKICFRHCPEQNSYEELWWWFIITFIKIAQSWEPPDKVFHQVFLLDWKLSFYIYLHFKCSIITFSTRFSVNSLFTFQLFCIHLLVQV